MTYKIKVKKIGRPFFRTYNVTNHQITNLVSEHQPDGQVKVYGDGPRRLELTLDSGDILVFGDMTQLVMKLGKDFFAMQDAAQKAALAKKVKLVDPPDNTSQNSEVAANTKPANVK